MNECTYVHVSLCGTNVRLKKLITDVCVAVFACKCVRTRERLYLFCRDEFICFCSAVCGTKFGMCICLIYEMVFICMWLRLRASVC